MTRRGMQLGIMAAALTLWPIVASAQERYALLVEGVSGTPEYAEQHRAWLDGLAGALKGKLEFPANHVMVLAEDPKAGEGKADAAGVRAAFKTLSGQVKPADELFVMLIGHGTTPDVGEAKFNLVGPDLDVSEWAGLVATVPGRLIFVDSTSSSSGFLKGLAGPNRIVITATNNAAMKYHTVFAEGFIEALQSPEADTDKDGRVSIWEAFVFATRATERHYEQAGTLQPERSSLDDTGAGVGRQANADGKDGDLAKATFLDVPPSTKATDPELKKLLQQQEDLTQQIRALEAKKATMAPDDYQKEFERLTVALATVGSEIRKRGGGQS